MKNIWRVLLVSIFLFSFYFFSASYVSSAGSAILKFNPETKDAIVGDNVELDAIVDAGQENILSNDAYIEYDSSILEYVSVQDGDFFPIVTTESIEPGRLYIGAYVNDPATSKTGEGTFATITFKALKKGTTTVTYFCDESVNETSEIIKDDFDATNIINCSENGTAEITITAGGIEPTNEPNPTNTPTLTEASSSTDDGSSSTGGTDITEGTNNVTELPQSGVVDNILRVSLPGVALLLIGAALKLLL